MRIALSRLLPALMLSLWVPASAATIFDLTTNTGLGNLFFSGGTNFIDVDGAGLGMNITGVLREGTVRSVVLSSPSVLNITSGKKSAVKVDYDLIVTFNSPVSDFYFGTKGTTNQETFTLQHPTENWIANILLSSSAYGSTSGLNTKTFTATGPNGGSPVTSVTQAAGFTSSVVYTLRQTGANASGEEYFWGTLGSSNPLAPVPEPGTLGTAASAVAIFAFLMRRRARRKTSAN